MLAQNRMVNAQTHRSTWRRVFVILLLSVIIAVPTGGSDLEVQAQGPGANGDPVFSALLESGMIEPLGHVRDVDDVSITLDWVYADTNVLAAHVTITGLPAQPADPNAARIMPRIELRDGQGNIFPESSGGTAVDEADPTTLSADFQFYTQFLAPNAAGDGYNVVDDYFASIYGDDLPERLPLTLAVTLVEQGPMPSAGTGSSLNSPEAVEFDVNVKVYGAITLQPHQSLTANNLTVTLEEVTITPAETTTLICYDLPDGGDWHPAVTLTVGGNESMLRGTRLTMLPDPSQTTRCEEQRFGIAVEDSAESLTVNVEALRTSIPDTREYWEAVRDALAEYDIVIDVVMSGGRYFDIVSKPDDMTDMEFGSTLYEVQQSQLPTVEGPWTFEVAIQ